MKLAFGLCIILAATSIAAAVPVSIDETSLKFLPADTKGIAFIDVAALLGAPFVQEVLKDGFPDLDALGTGFDLKRDVDRITLGKLGERNVLAILQGRFDPFKVEQYFRDKDKTPEVYLGHTLYHDGEGAVVVLNNVVLSGKTDAVKKAIDQMQLPGSPPLRGELVAAIQTIEAGNQLWAAGDFSVNDLQAIGVRGPAPVLEMLQSLKSGTYQLRVDTGIHLRATASFGDAESARNLADLARGALALVQVQAAKQSSELVQLLAGVQIIDSGTTLTLSVDESGELLKRLTDYYRPTIEKNVR